jgi:hypothetical protein
MGDLKSENPRGGEFTILKTPLFQLLKYRLNVNTLHVNLIHSKHPTFFCEIKTWKGMEMEMEMEMEWKGMEMEWKGMEMEMEWKGGLIALL